MQNKLLLTLILFSSLGVFAQQKFAPEQVIVGELVRQTMPLRDYPTLPNNLNLDPKTLTIVPNESKTQIEINEVPPTVIDNIQETIGKIASRNLEQNFIGASSTESGFYPPDPTGAVGPNHYVHSVNSLVKIFSKTGTLLLGPVNLGTFLGFGGNSGDPIVLYDQLADRWVVSEFGNISGGNSLAIGVSTSSDPTGSYNVYQYTFSGFPDYPKYGMWPDAYYGTVNLDGASTRAFAMERDALLSGAPNPKFVIFSLPGVVVNPNQVKSPVPVNLLGQDLAPNTPGYIIYLQDDAWTGVSNDHLKIWEIDMDWNNTSNSTISSPIEIPTDPFDAGEIFGQGAVSQPGTNQKLAAHGGIISFGANYRSFANHNSWLITFNTFIDANDTGGIRWIELRNSNTDPWSLYQEGTYAPADGHSRFMSSSAMDALGNIGLAYSVGSSTLPVGLRYTGRFDGDPLGTMTVAETTIINGVGVRTNSYRYGDYAHTSMDPDNLTFWHTSDYFFANNAWRTQIASFKISGTFAKDVGISAIIQPENGVLTNNETVQVTVRNYGTVSQSNIPLQLRVNGNLIATETLSAAVASGATANYTFTQKADLSTPGATYTIEVKTNLTGDEFNPNDPYSKEVTNLFANDVGATTITEPISAPELSNNETVKAVIRNYGAAPQSNFNVQYDIDGGTPVIEAFTGTIAPEQEATYTFTQKADFSVIGTYNLTVKTDLTGDGKPTNDAVTTEIENLICQPNMNCSLGHGFRLFSVAEINNPSACEGYGDFTDMVANLAPNSTNQLEITTNYGGQYVKVWIDFNDDSIFTTDEIVVESEQLNPGQGAGTYTTTLDMNIPAVNAVGLHRMRAKTNWNGVVPNDACEDTPFGETEDYTVNLGVLGVDDLSIRNGELLITSTDNKVFNISLVSDYDGMGYISVYNIAGQELGFKPIGKVDGAYNLKLDMSFAASGVYIIKAGGQSTKVNKTARIIVR
ncbi:GEVED domain-containing protein [Aequorivita sp. Q41]|uniref:GEVED domain-containing protein n=1 Tax=Aequorivita sp. Q41 TaxID=3153300 RepID=UPI0032427D4E